MNSLLKARLVDPRYMDISIYIFSYSFRQVVPQGAWAKCALRVRRRNLRRENTRVRTGGGKGRGNKPPLPPSSLSPSIALQINISCVETGNCRSCSHQNGNCIIFWFVKKYMHWQTEKYERREKRLRVFCEP